MKHFPVPKARIARAGVLALLAALLCAAAAGAAPKDFFRIRKGADGQPAALETAVSRYEGNIAGRKITVDLVAAIHVAEPEYYRALNEDFKHYDAVLYELIAPEDRKVPPREGERPDNPVSSLQGMIKNLLSLEFQLDGVDYHAKNFVHADLSPDEFFGKMTERGDSVWTILARVLAQDLFPADSGADSTRELKILLALMSSDEKTRAFRLRRYVAADFGKVEELVARIEGPSGSAIIADRNARALAVLDEQIKAGKSTFAIFYGGAHMPDMERRLLEKFPLKQTEFRWLVAWRLQP